MDKSDLVEHIYECMETNQYDKRFLPFFECYMSKCVQKYNWNVQTFSDKLDEYSQKINGIEFINIGRKRVKADLDNKMILLDERIKYSLEDETLDEYVESAFEEQDKILKTDLFKDINSIKTDILKEKIRYIYKTYDKKLADEKIAYEISTLVQKKNYDKRFIPFLKEYFFRSSKIYNWNRDELIKKIKNFKANVDSIKMEKISKKCAKYYPEKKVIYVNKNLYTYSNDIIIKNIFREFGYATNYTKIENKVYENGLYSNTNNDSNERLLNEYAEEVSANYLTGRVPYSNRLYTTCRVSKHDRKDYNNKAAYSASMFSAAFGISEFEFAKLKDKGRERFYEYFRARFEHLDTKKYINEFFDIVSTQQNANDGAFSTKNISKQFARMYNLAMNILDERQKSELIEEDKFEKKLQTLKMNYARYKVVDTLKQAKRNLSLESRVLNKEINEKNYIRKYSRISKISKRKFKPIALQIHKNNDTDFNNRELEKIIITQFKFPVLSKIFRNEKDQILMLYEGVEKNSVDNLDDDLQSRKTIVDKAKIVVPKKELFE